MTPACVTRSFAWLLALSLLPSTVLAAQPPAAPVPEATEPRPEAAPAAPSSPPPPSTSVEPAPTPAEAGSPESAPSGTPDDAAAAPVPPQAPAPLAPEVSPPTPAPPSASEERQVPFDAEGRLLRLDRELVRKLGLFDREIADFEAAQLFQITDGGGFVLEFERETEEGLTRRRRLLSPSDREELRRAIEARVAERSPESTLNHEGRVIFLAETAFMGLAHYGWALPTTFDVDDDRAFVGLYMLTAGTSFLVPFLITQSQPMTYGGAYLAYYGATRGILWGSFAKSLALGEETSEQEDVGATMVGSALGLAGGAIWGVKADMTAGTAHVIENGGDYLTAAFLGGAYVAGLLDRNPARLAGGLGLAGSALGIAGGAWLAGTQPFTWGDAEVMRTGGLLGAATGGMVADWFDAVDKPFVGAALLGGTSGLLLGHWLVTGEDYTLGEGILTDLSTAAGGLLAMGLTYLIGGEGGDETALITSAVLGGWGGYAAMLAFLDGGADDDGKPSAWRFRLSPEGILAAAALTPATRAPLSIATLSLDL